MATAPNQALAQPATVGQRQKSILGARVRQMIIVLINGFSHGHQAAHKRGKPITVQFKGNMAYTNGRQVVLPKLPDLAQLDYNAARSLIGYAAHESAHIMYTRFETITEAIESGVLKGSDLYLKLVKHFENAIEDYRIERLLTAQWPGTKADLIILRNSIHPDDAKIEPQFWLNPCISGPLALTWTGCQLNGMNVIGVPGSLSKFHPDVHAMILDWTERMEHVGSSDECLVLAMEFAKEAIEYVQQQASPSQSGDPSNSQQNDDADGDDSQSDQPSANQGSSNSDGNKSKDGQNKDQSDPSKSELNEKPSSPGEDDQSSRDQNSEGAAGNDPDNQGKSSEEHKGDPSNASASTGNETQSGDQQNSLSEELEKALADALKDLEISAGEIDVSEVIDAIIEIAQQAPQYDSSDTQNHGVGGRPRAQAWTDTRYKDLEAADNAHEVVAELKAQSSSTVAATARVIRRKLKAEEQKGEIRGKTSGEFDIRNISDIVRGTGNVYKQQWNRQAIATNMKVLIDFSGSMAGAEIQLAMTSALAIEIATIGTNIETEIFGYTGMSPYVEITAFKNRKAHRNQVLKNIGSFQNVKMSCTPTGVAMSAIIEQLDKDPASRKLLVVLTDGMADDMKLCAQVCTVAAQRGIEVVAIGIMNDSVKRWAPKSQIIQQIEELPGALLSTLQNKAKRRA